MRVGEDALDQTPAVLAEHLVEALRPAEALVPRVAEGDGLLVVEDRRGRVGDAHALQDARRGELDVLGEQVPLPAARLLDDVGGDEEARARDGAAGVERQARLVEELGLAQEPHGIAGGDPVGSVVLGVAVARGRLGAGVEGLVHLAEVVHVEDVVGVEDEVGLVALVGVLRADDREAVVERIALAHLLGVVAREDDGARIARDLGGVVRAVVGDDKHVDELGGIVLHLDGMDEVADDRALVARGHHHGEAVVLLGDVLLGLARQDDEHVEKLVGVANGEYREHAEIEDIDERYLREKLIEHLHSFNHPPSRKTSPGALRAGVRVPRPRTRPLIAHAKLSEL